MVPKIIDSKNYGNINVFGIDGYGLQLRVDVSFWQDLLSFTIKKKFLIILFLLYFH